MSEVPPIVHPGEFIADEIAARGWTFEIAAGHSMLKTETIRELCSGHRKITPIVAHGLGVAFGTGAEIWMGLQRQFDQSRPKRA